MTHGLDAFVFITGKDGDIGKAAKLVLSPKNVKDIVAYLDEKHKSASRERGFRADTPPRKLNLVRFELMFYLVCTYGGR